MTGVLINLVLTCGVCIAMLGSLPARAADGRINFSGAVVVPTCAIALEQTIIRSAAVMSQQRGCPSSGRSAIAGAYMLRVTHLSPHSPDHLLSYFASYTQAINAHGGSAQLVTLIYD